MSIFLAMPENGVDIDDGSITGQLRPATEYLLRSCLDQRVLKEELTVLCCTVVL